MRRFALLVLIFIVTGCSRFSGTSEPPAHLASDFSGRDGRFTRSAFQSEARGWVYFSVYLPPDWTPDDTETYPLIFFLHGQGGDEFAFPRSVQAREINQWIEQGELPPFVLIAPRGADVRNSVQWYHRPNEIMLTSEGAGELRAYAREHYRAGVDPETVSVHGHSRGATGALFMAMNHPDKFVSAVANAFVSDYALGDRQDDADENRDRVLESGIPIRMVIGTRDEYVLQQNRTATPEMHEHLLGLGISHEYEVLSGVSHALRSIWDHRRDDGRKNGLYELQFHARAWRAGRPGGPDMPEPIGASRG